MYDSEVRIEYVQHMGDDLMVADAARVSYGKDRRKHRTVEPRDAKLIGFLADNRHMTPFEHNSLTVLAEMPVFTRGHVVRHRTFSYNEISRRYTSMGLKVWKPKVWMGQSSTNHQASNAPLPEHEQAHADTIYTQAIQHTLEAYESLIALGVSREQARAVLPQGLYTSFYMTGNLRNWCHFIGLRNDPEHAQDLDVSLARQVIDIAYLIWPYAMDALLGE